MCVTRGRCLMSTCSQQKEHRYRLRNREITEETVNAVSESEVAKTKGMVLKARKLEKEKGVLKAGGKGNV